MYLIDFETRSTVDLKARGTSPYARHPTTEVMCLAYAKQYGEPKLWKPGDPKPAELLEAIERGVPIFAHNAFFERLIWHWICHVRMGWPDVPESSWRCTLAMCSRLTLPRTLAGAGEALGMATQKDLEGHRVMMKLCRPKGFDGERPIWHSDPADLQKLYSYCLTDVKSELEILDSLDSLTPAELRVWQLDQTINLRGIPIDVEGLRHALAVAEKMTDQGGMEIDALTDGKVQTLKQVAALRKWLKDTHDLDLPSLAKSVVEDCLNSLGEDHPARTVLELRLHGGKASTAKIAAMLDRADDDGRVRGNLVYHGAGTGRWAGAGIQIQNFPRGTLKPFEIELAHGLLDLESPLALDLLLGPALEVLSGSLRSFIRAESGKRLLVCDFASIEARVLAWIAGQEDLLVLFREGGDVYKDMASSIYSVPFDEITKTQRQMGKTAILGCGYGMGAKQFVVACKLMAGVEITKRFAKQVIKAYREKNDRIRSFWSEIQTACIRAIQTKAPHRVGRLCVECDGDWLTIELPSRRKLHYRQPELVMVPAPWTVGRTGSITAEDSQETIDALDDLDVKLGEWIDGAWRDCFVPESSVRAVAKRWTTCLEKVDPQLIPQIQFRGVLPTSRKWGPKRTYGGSLTENVVQAIARDFLVEAMLRLEMNGYSIIATVHDEVICEVPIGRGSLEQFEQIMAQVPRWGTGCPIGVEGYEAERYRK